MVLSKASPQKRPELTIIIPAYCEERRIGSTLDALAVFLNTDNFFKQMNVEVLVVAADAPDKTQEIITNKKSLFKNCRLLTPGTRSGKGRDVQYGMLHANGKVAIFMDADLAVPLTHLNEFYNACMEGSDLVVGTRNMLTYRSNFMRGTFASTGNFIYRLLSGLSVKDTQCGFKMFNEQARRLCFSKLTILGWGFDIEVLAIAQSNDLSIKSIQIDDYKHMPFSTHTEGIMEITIHMVRDLGHITGNRIRGVYDRVPKK